MEIRHKCRECNIKKAIDDIVYINDHGSNMENTENVSNLIYNIGISSSFAHKLHKTLQNDTTNISYLEQ